MKEDEKFEKENDLENINNFKELLERTDFTKVPGLKTAHIKLLEKIKENILNGNAIYTKGWLISNNSNISTDKNYDLFNTMVLNIAKDEKGYKSSQWLTFKQMKNLNDKYKLSGEDQIKLKKGSIGEKIVYTSIYNKLEKKNMSYDELNKLSLNEKLEKLNNNEIYFFHKEATVFNIDCFENIPKDLLKEEIDDIKEIDIDLAKLMANEMNLKMNFTSSDKACYYPLKDCIELPKPELWKNNEMFKRTLFHELSHATAHETRLNREIKNNKGSEKYSKEELIAETSSLFLSKNFDYETETNISTSSSYLNTYANILVNKPKLILNAIREATRVSNYLLDIYEIAREKQLDLEKNNLEKGEKIMEQKEIFLEKNEIEILGVIKENIADYMETLDTNTIINDMFDGYFTYPYEVYDFLKDNNLNAFEMIGYIKEYSEEQGYNALENLDVTDEIKVGTLYLNMKAEELIFKYIDFENINQDVLMEDDLKNIENQIKDFKIYEKSYITNENLTFNETKDIVKELIENNHQNFIKSLISIERNIDNEDVLQEIYNFYMENDNIQILNEEIEEKIENLENQNQIKPKSKDLSL